MFEIFREAIRTIGPDKLKARLPEADRLTDGTTSWLPLADWREYCKNHQI